MDEVFHIVNETTREPAANPVVRVIKEGVVVGLANHTTVIARNGVETPIEDSAAPIRDRNGNVIGVVMVFRDVADQRSLEWERERLLISEREARSEAEQANEAKNQFLAILSHELRTPPGPDSCNFLASRRGADLRPDDLRPTFEMIRQNVLLQSRLIDDLLDVMRIGRGKMPLVWEVADCHEVIRLAVDVCQSEILTKRLTLELELRASARFVNADRARLQQAFWNLIKNAVKFTPEGGAITIRTRNHHTGNNGDQSLEIEFSDSGIGIPREMLTKVFDPFQQGEISITRRYGGMGLGLSICRGIVDAHGGTLAAWSDGKDRGTTFTITLAPASATGSVLAANGDGPPPPGAAREPSWSCASCSSKTSPRLCG